MSETYTITTGTNADLFAADHALRPTGKGAVLSSEITARDDPRRTRRRI